MEEELNTKNKKFFVLNWTDFWLALIITTGGLLLRYIFHYGQKYVIDNDSYHYLSISLHKMYPGDLLGYLSWHYGESVTQIILYIITGATFFLFYFLCRHYVNEVPAAIASLFFAISPLVFFNNQFGVYDKNVYTLFMIVLICYILTIRIEWIRIMLIILLSYAFSLLWSGYKGFVIIILIYYFFYLFFILGDKKINAAFAMTYRLISYFFLICIIPFVIYGWNDLVGLIYPNNKFLISELQPIWNIGLFAEYLVMILVFIFVTKKLGSEKKDIYKLDKYLFLYTGFIISFFAMCWIFRMNIFFMPFLYIWFAIMFEDWKCSWASKSTIVILLLLFTMFTSSDIYLRKPLMNDNMFNAIDYMNSYNTSCIIGVWSNGAIYEYYSNKSVMFSSSSMGFEQQVGYLVDGDPTDCSVIWDKVDVAALEWMLAFEKRNVSVDDYYIIRHTNDSKMFGRYHVLPEGIVLNIT